MNTGRQRWADAIQETFRKGLVWLTVGVVTTAGGALIATSRDEAVHETQIRAIQRTQRSEGATLATLTAEVAQLDVNTAALTQQLIDQRAMQAQRNAP